MCVCLCFFFFFLLPYSECNSNRDSVLSYTSVRSNSSYLGSDEMGSGKGSHKRVVNVHGVGRQLDGFEIVCVGGGGEDGGGTQCSPCCADYDTQQLVTLLKRVATSIASVTPPEDERNFLLFFFPRRCFLTSHVDHHVASQASVFHPANLSSVRPDSFPPTDTIRLQLLLPLTSFYSSSLHFNDVFVWFP